MTSLKSLFNPIAVFAGVFSENYLEFRPPKDEFNNLLNPDMNNVEAIDYLNKDWTSHHDTLLPRYAQEFPRMSTKYKTKKDHHS